MMLPPSVAMLRHLRCGCVTRRIRQRRIPLLDFRMSRDLAQSRQRPQPQTILSSGDAAKTVNVTDVDQLRRRNDVFLHQVQQIDAACLDNGAVAQLA